MSAAASERVTVPSGPALRTRIAAVVIVVALAGLAAYALFSGPTKVPAPAAPTEAVPGKAKPAAPAGEEPGERERGDGR
jgi:hypothetical protein